MTRAYNLQRQHAGDDAPGTLDAAFHLATLYRVQNDFNNAKSLFLRVLEGRKHLYGDDHRDTLEAVNGLAFIMVLEARVTARRSCTSRRWKPACEPTATAIRSRFI